ncbi:unnamed protein product [Adineta steineri]|uniref:G-protein coupled receptors family 1 profile domain-containing protein n=1 Tax=Adineta steineri TaxID=433720 RepID=A0A813WA76_9BILA|nr:unnamed protein product [Adineta steineri]
MQMNYLRLGFITPLTAAFYLINQFVIYGIWYGATFSIVWISIERHILIFHSTRVATARGRLLFHYIPLMLFSLYAPILYAYLIFFYPCERIYDGTQTLCGDACFWGSISDSFAQYMSIAHDIMPIVIIVVFGAALLLRYIPLMLFSLYAPILYAYLIFFYPCERIYDGTQTLCGDACFWGSISDSFAQYMSIAHDIMPIVIIVVFGAALLLRIIIQKRCLRQVNEWRKYRKMIIQFIFISSTFVIFYLPYTVVDFVKALGFSSFGINVIQYFLPLTNVPSIALPYATLITLPGLKQKLFALTICKAKQNTIHTTVA